MIKININLKENIILNNIHIMLFIEETAKILFKFIILEIISINIITFKNIIK